jgi:hypothetical protein
MLYGPAPATMVPSARFANRRRAGVHFAVRKRFRLGVCIRFILVFGRFVYFCVCCRMVATLLVLADGSNLARRFDSRFGDDSHCSECLTMLESAISVASKLMGQGGPTLERPVEVLMESEDKFALNRFVSALAETMRLNGAHVLSALSASTRSFRSRIWINSSPLRLGCRQLPMALKNRHALVHQRDMSKNPHLPLHLRLSQSAAPTRDDLSEDDCALSCRRMSTMHGPKAP